VPARFFRRPCEAPALLQRLVAEEALDRVDADGLVDLAAVADAFAGVVADPPHDRGERVVARQVPPRGFVVAALGVEQPALDVFTGRALRVAGRQPVDVERTLGTPGAGLVGERRPRIERDRERLLHRHRNSRRADPDRTGCRRSRLMP
jgi:hypothetical protein